MKEKMDDYLEIQHDEDYVYEQYLKEEKLNEEYWQQRAIEEHYEILNAQYEARFCYMDIIAAVSEVTGNDILAEQIANKLNELYIRRMTFDAQMIN